MILRFRNESSECIFSSKNNIAAKVSSPKGLSYLTSRPMKSYLGNIFLLTQILIYILHRTYLILVVGSEILKFLPEPEIEFSTNLKMHHGIKDLFSLIHQFCPPTFQLPQRASGYLSWVYWRKMHSNAVRDNRLRDKKQSTVLDRVNMSVLRPPPFLPFLSLFLL